MRRTPHMGKLVLVLLGKAKIWWRNKRKDAVRCWQAVRDCGLGQEHQPLRLHKHLGRTHHYLTKNNTPYILVLVSLFSTLQCSTQNLIHCHDNGIEMKHLDS